MYLDNIKLDKCDNSGIAHSDSITPTAEDYGDMSTDDRPEADEEEAVDKYLNAELIFNLGTNNELCGCVVKQLRELEGRLNANPLFDTCKYKVEFTDGSWQKYQANLIAENMFAQVDDEG